MQENAGDLLREFEEEYGRDDRDLRQQEKTDGDKEFWRGSFPGRFATKKLYGWNDKRYNREY